MVRFEKFRKKITQTSMNTAQKKVETPVIQTLQKSGGTHEVEAIDELNSSNTLNTRCWLFEPSPKFLSLSAIEEEPINGTNLSYTTVGSLDTSSRHYFWLLLQFFYYSLNPVG